jgi:isocitrate dehydrogenase
MISNRGARVYPGGLPETFCTDHWRCRYVSADGNPISHNHVLQLLSKLNQAGYDFIKTEHLCTFDWHARLLYGYGTGAEIELR